MSVAVAQVSPYRAAQEAKDSDALAAACSPDVVFNSPITKRTRFSGRDQVRELFRVVLDVYEEVEVLEELDCGHNIRVMRFRGRIGKQELDQVQLLRLDDDGRVWEITMYVRPLAALTALTAALGPVLARRHARWRGAAVAAMSRPLARMVAAGDGLGVRLSDPPGALSRPPR
jgi:hypothetical protein